ncbi:MAG: WYL domain-containing protein [Bacillota bacterium]|nr:WYL domain-containing protein [Bacillota bacterium]
MPNERNKFNEIKRAIPQRYVISFAYVNADGAVSSRFVEPLKLLFKGNSWYLVAYCRFRQEHRIFRISRIKNVKVGFQFPAPI